MPTTLIRVNRCARFASCSDNFTTLSRWGGSHRKHAAAVNLALAHLTKLPSKRLVGWGRSARLRLGNITESLRADDDTCGQN